MDGKGGSHFGEGLGAPRWDKSVKTRIRGAESEDEEREERGGGETAGTDHLLPVLVIAWAHFSSTASPLLQELPGWEQPPSTSLDHREHSGMEQDEPQHLSSPSVMEGKEQAGFCRAELGKAASVPRLGPARAPSPTTCWDQEPPAEPHWSRGRKSCSEQPQMLHRTRQMPQSLTAF